jgi:folate-binding protein YgfZ
MTHHPENTDLPPGANSQLIDLAPLGLLRVAGEGAKKLLQGQLTCDLEEVSPTQSRLGAYCQPQGRMVCLFRLFLYRDAYYLQMPADMLAETLTTLKKYAVFFKVTLTDASEEMMRLSFSGEQAKALLQQHFSPLPQTPDSVLSQENYLVLTLPGTTPHYEILGQSAFLQPLKEQLLEQSQEADLNAWYFLNIAAGIPTIHPTTSGKLLPHDINLPQINGVSFNKGCYTGQEIIARMHYRGQLKKYMVRGRVKTTSLLLPGMDIFAEKACGILVDSCQENADTYQVLFIADKTAIESRQLFLHPAKLDPIELLTLPY